MLAELAEQWYERMAAIPELERWTVPEQRADSIENACNDIGREVAGLIGGRTLPRTCPQEVVDSARIAAASGFPLWACVQAYRAGHAVQWQAWTEAVEARRLDAKARRTLLQAGSEYMFAYADQCARWIELEYTRERDRRLRSEEQLRTQLVRDLLDGKHADTSKLGYQLDGWHIALIASGYDPDRVLQPLSRQLGGQMLTVAADAITWWAWIRLSRVRSAAIERKLRAVPLPPGISLAIGEPGHGPAGFRQSHRDAQDAAAIGERRGQAITRYSEVALEALATANLDQARSFVLRELGTLARDDQRSDILRRTLRAYFAAGQRASSTALVLGVHERTIGNRVRAVERVIGGSVLSRRAELEVALRLHPLVLANEDRAGPSVEPPPAWTGPCP